VEIRTSDTCWNVRRSVDWMLRVNLNGEERGPLFLVSVASKELSSAVSLLFATLAERSMSVAVPTTQERVPHQASYWATTVNVVVSVNEPEVAVTVTV